MSCPPKPDAKPYRLRPKDVTAFRFDGEPVEGFERVSAGQDNDGNPAYNLVVNPFIAPMYARPGDWVVTSDAGDAVVSPEDFARDYEPA